MKEFNYDVFLNDKNIANINILAKNEIEADIIIKRKYPPAKGFKCVLTNDK